MKIKHTHPKFRDKTSRVEALADLHRSCLAQLRDTGRDGPGKKKERTA